MSSLYSSKSLQLQSTTDIYSSLQFFRTFFIYLSSLNSSSLSPFYPSFPDLWQPWSQLRGMNNAVNLRSLQKVQGHRTAHGHRAGVDVDVNPPTGGPVGHPPPNPATLCDRSVHGSRSWHSGSFAKYSDIGLVTISLPACCVSYRATGLPVMVHDMHTRTRRPDYLQACPTGPPVDAVKSALTPALWPGSEYDHWSPIGDRMWDV